MTKTKDERINRKDHPEKTKIAGYIPTELDKALQHDLYGAISDSLTQAFVVMLALQDAPEIARTAMRVYSQAVPVAVHATKRAIIEYVEGVRMKEYFATLPAAEKARILAGMKK